MFEFHEAEELLRTATPPRAGSTSWYDACDLVATEIKRRLRERFERGFPVDVYGDEVGLIVRVRGDGYGVTPWSVDLPVHPPQERRRLRGERLGGVEREVDAAYVVD